MPFRTPSDNLLLNEGYFLLMALSFMPLFCMTLSHLSLLFATKYVQTITFLWKKESTVNERFSQRN